MYQNSRTHCTRGKGGQNARGDKKQRPPPHYYTHVLPERRRSAKLKRIMDGLGE